MCWSTPGSVGRCGDVGQGSGSCRAESRRGSHACPAGNHASMPPQPRWRPQLQPDAPCPCPCRSKSTDHAEAHIPGGTCNQAHLPLPLPLQIHHAEVDDGPQVGLAVQHLQKTGGLRRVGRRAVQPARKHGTEQVQARRRDSKVAQQAGRDAAGCRAWRRADDILPAT